MAGRTIAIGDIHGCSRALRVLLEAIAPEPDDVIIPLGDIVDRGSNSRDVIEQCLDLKKRCDLRPVIGNHEEMMLNVLRKRSSPHVWIGHGGAATLDSYGFDGDLGVVPEEHLRFLESFSDFVELDTHFFVHANYDPKLPLSRQVPNTVRWLSLEKCMPAPHVSGKVAVVGHTPDRSGEIFSLRHIKCIDTYCHGGGWLTALEIGTGRVWQVNDRGQVR